MSLAVATKWLISDYIHCDGQLWLGRRIAHAPMAEGHPALVASENEVSCSTTGD